MLRPAVLHPVSLPDFLRFLTHHHAELTNLVVCSSRANFEKHLLHCLENGRSPEASVTAASQDGGLGVEDQEQALPTRPATFDGLLTPTLHNLFATATIRLSFCASLESLRAYLSSLTAKSPDGPSSPSSIVSTSSGRTDAYPILALLSPIALHKETTAFSAQGLSRTFAIAVEAAACREQRLILAECPVPDYLLPRRNDAWMEDEDILGAGVRLEAEGEGDGDREAEAARDRQAGEGPSDDCIGGITVDEDPWAEKLSILNVTTKSFGVGDRGWAGRTVTAKTVAERWCRFETPQASSFEDGGVYT